MKIDKSWYKKPKEKNFRCSIAAGGVVVRKENGKLLVALIGSNYYSDFRLPKGSQENNEEIETTARREISEEVGLFKLKMVCKLGIKERLSFEKTDWKITHYFLFETDEIFGRQNLQPGEEDMKLIWFNLDNLPDFFWPEQKELINENIKRIKRLLS
jgi:ADP-ribose pyrophosphatase YjhB (NUDIX family)